MLKNFDHINMFLQRNLYFWQGCAGIQILGMTYQISHNTFFPNGTTQSYQGGGDFQTEKGSSHIIVKQDVRVWH